MVRKTIKKLLEIKEEKGVLALSDEEAQRLSRWREREKDKAYKRELKEQMKEWEKDGATLDQAFLKKSAKSSDR